MELVNKIKRVWKSYNFKETQLTKGSTFYGSAQNFLSEEIEFAQGTQEWKNSAYSYKLVVEKIESNKTYYYSFYIDPEGIQNISKTVKFISTDQLIKNVNNLRLLAE